MNWFKKAQNNKKMYFLRSTGDPYADLKRNFSCYSPDLWTKNPIVVERYKQIKMEEGEPEAINVQYDNLTNSWCLFAEKGLSSFAFYDEVSYNDAIKNMSYYSGFGGSVNKNMVGVFSSSEYDLGAGISDQEDLFRNGEFLGFIPLGIPYQDCMKRIGEKSFEDVRVPSIEEKRTMETMDDEQQLESYFQGLM